MFEKRLSEKMHSEIIDLYLSLFQCIYYFTHFGFSISHPVETGSGLVFLTHLLMLVDKYMFRRFQFRFVFITFDITRIKVFELNG